MISQTGGHGDFRLPNELPAAPDSSHFSERIGATAIADDADTVLQAGARTVGAGRVAAQADGRRWRRIELRPLDVTQYTVPELRAAVEAAENWGTYIMVHAYTPRAVRQAIKTGIKCIEHGQLLDDPTAKLMAEKGVWWSMQPFLDDRPSAFPEGSPKRIKQLQMYGGTDTAYALAKKFNIKTAWGAAVIPPMSSIIMTAMLGLSAARAPAAASATTTASAAFARRPRPTFSIALRSIRFILCSPLDALARTGWAARWIFGRPLQRMGRRP